MSAAHQIVLDVIHGGRPVVRNLHYGEIIPPEFEVGFDKLGMLDRDWVWVLDQGGEIKGILVASPCHQTVVIWRLVGKEPLKLLRTFGRTVRKLGYQGFMTLLDETSPTQRKLFRIVKRCGGGTMPARFMLAAAPWPKRLR
jgi:hypothetical protein